MEQKRPLVGLVKPAESIDRSTFNFVTRTPNTAFGDPRLVEATGNLVLSPGACYVVDTSVNTAVCYLSGFEGKLGQACTVINDGSNPVFVLPPKNVRTATISGWNSYPLLRQGSVGTFVMTASNRFNHVGPEQYTNWPRFRVLVTDKTQVQVKAIQGTNAWMSVRMNDGRICTKQDTGSLVVDFDNTGEWGVLAGDTVSAGDIFHLFAIPTGDTDFAVIATDSCTPSDGAGPTNYSVYRYLWSVYVVSTGPIVLDPHYQLDNWYYSVDKSIAAHRKALVDGAQPTLNEWNALDGNNMAGAGTTTNLYSTVPMGIADAVDLFIWVATNSTASQTGHVYIASGDETNPGFSPTTDGVARTAAVSTGSGAGYTSASDQMAMSETVPISNTGIVASFQTFGANWNLRIVVRGYRNKLWGQE